MRRVVMLAVTSLAMVVSATVPANAAVRSATVVTVKSAVTLTVPTTNAVLSKGLVVTGKVSPGVRRSLVIQGYTAGRWVTIASTTTSLTGTYAATVTPHAVGSWPLRAVAAAKLQYRAATSAVALLTVRRATKVLGSLVSVAVPQNVLAGITGIVLPAEADRNVRVDRLVGTVWTAVGTARTNRFGGYLITVPTATLGAAVLRVVVPQTPTDTLAITPSKTMTVTGRVQGGAEVGYSLVTHRLTLHEQGGLHRNVVLPAVDVVSRSGRAIWIDFGGATGTDRVYAGGPGLPTKLLGSASGTACVAALDISEDGLKVAWIVGRRLAIGTGKTCLGATQVNVETLAVGVVVHATVPAAVSSGAWADLAFARGSQYVEVLGGDYDTNGVATTAGAVLVDLTGTPVMVSGLTDLGSWRVVDVVSPAGTVAVLDITTGAVARLTIGGTDAPVSLTSELVIQVSGNADGSKVVYLMSIGGADHVLIANGDFTGEVDEGVNPVGDGGFATFVGNAEVALVNSPLAPDGVTPQAPVTQIRSATTFDLLATYTEYEVNDIA